ncbi:MAG: caspase family protein [Nitrosomonas sp.]|nr:MAG: caspase family protein [Nitrosomonas sp.]
MYREARKALIVGIDDYPCSPLEGCVSDAVQLSKLLKSHYDGKPNFEIKTLLSSNGEIEKTLLKKEIENLFSGSPVIALLYFAGHGYLNSYGGYLVTQDFTRYDEGVSMDEIMRCANKSDAQNKVVILDCCYSGRLAAPQLVDRKVSELADGVTILASCQATETAQENKKGIFSSLLIDAIDGQCADLTGNILPSNIYAYIDRTLGQWGGQRPIFKTNVSAFISLKEVEPLIELSVLRKIVTYFSDRDAEYPLDPSYEFTEPGADDKCVAIFKELQKMEGVGLVAPVGEEHMYYAAINRKSCRLTNLGKQYWSLIKLEKV